MASTTGKTLIAIHGSCLPSTFKKTQERNVAEQVERETKKKYREHKMKLKQAIKESKERVDEDV